MEASALIRAHSRGLLNGRSPLLKLQDDEKLVMLTRAGNEGAFEVIFERYRGRLLSFCRHMLKSQEDAEDILQEVFANAYRAMLADDRAINVRPWLYRIARNRSLNHLRRQVAIGQDSMDVFLHDHGTSTEERVEQREEFRNLLEDIGQLPETQRTALLMREIDSLSYEEIARAMDTTIPSIKSLLVRARISLAEGSQARALTCDEVRVELAEAAEGLAKLGGPSRRHVRECEGCGEFRKQLRSDTRALAALLPVGPLLMLKKTILAKLGLSSSAGGGGGATVAGGGGAVATAGGSVGIGATISGAASGVLSAAGGVLGAKMVAGVAAAALIAGGAAVEVRKLTGSHGEGRNGDAVERGIVEALRSAGVLPAGTTSAGGSGQQLSEALGKAAGGGSGSVADGDKHSGSSGSDSGGTTNGGSGSSSSTAPALSAPSAGEYTSGITRPELATSTPTRESLPDRPRRESSGDGGGSGIERPSVKRPSRGDVKEKTGTVKDKGDELKPAAPEKPGTPGRGDLQAPEAPSTGGVVAVRHSVNLR